MQALSCHCSRVAQSPRTMNNAHDLQLTCNRTKTTYIIPFCRCYRGAAAALQASGIRQRQSIYAFDCFLIDAVSGHGFNKDSYHSTTTPDVLSQCFPPAMALSENKQRMARGELYTAFTPELIAERARCKHACARYRDAGDVSRRKLTELFRE